MQIEQITDVDLLKKKLHAAQCHLDRLDLYEQAGEIKELDLDILRLQMRLEEVAPEPLKKCYLDHLL
jgi:hypothetical protein